MDYNVIWYWVQSSPDKVLINGIVINVDYTGDQPLINLDQ